MISNILKIRPTGLLAGFFALLLPVSAQQLIEDSRNVLGELIEVKKQIATESNEWETEKEIILDTIETLERQIEASETRLEEIEDNTTSDEEKRAELQSRLQELEEMTSDFDPVISGFEARLRAIRPMLPEPLTDKMDRLLSQLPKEGEAGNRRLINNRAVVVIGIHHEINNFHTSAPAEADDRRAGTEFLRYLLRPRIRLLCGRQRDHRRRGQPRCRRMGIHENGRHRHGSV